MACAVINITIDGGAATKGNALAVTATLSGATGAAIGEKKKKIEASALKSILFDALVSSLESTETDAISHDDEDEPANANRGVVPVFLALEAALMGPDTEESITVIPLIRSPAVRKRVRAILDRGKDYWIFDCRGTPIQDHEAVVGLEYLPAPALDLRLVPLHTVPPSPFLVSSTGTRKWIDAFGKPFVAYTFQVKHAQLEWALSKRFSEFSALHDTLKKSAKKGGAAADDPLRLEAGALPPLPPRWPKPSTEEGIEERRLKLEGYLQALVAAPGAMENPHVLGFLGIMNPRTDLPLDDPRRPGRRRQVVHMSVLPSTLRWGDIVLFRCAHVYAGLQRAVTRAEWDHVGLVVPSAMASSAGLDLLESTGEGVTRYPLMARMRAYASEFTEVIAVRRLEGPRTHAVRQALHGFVKDVEGKPYGFFFNLFPGRRASTTEAGAAPVRRRSSGALLLERLFRRKSNGSEEEIQQEQQQQPQQQQKEEDRFFCSQLVAAGLKAMGVLPPDINSSRFWPGSFAEGGDVDAEGMLSRGWRFEEVTLVDKKTLELGSAVLTRA